LSDFNETHILASGFRNILRYISCKSVQWEPNFTQTERHDEANSRFRQFSQAPVNVISDDLHHLRTPLWIDCDQNVW